MLALYSLQLHAIYRDLVSKELPKSKDQDASLAESLRLVYGSMLVCRAGQGVQACKSMSMGSRQTLMKVEP